MSDSEINAKLRKIKENVDIEDRKIQEMTKLVR